MREKQIKILTNSIGQYPFYLAANDNLTALCTMAMQTPCGVEMSNDQALKEKRSIL